jgi:putative tryptophan/tyrosine transport system substrate-binding protein
MRRRDFIAGIAGSAAWPFAACAQDKVRSIGVLLPARADDAEFQARHGAFQQELQKLGWEIGRNMRIDSRWATNPAEIRRHAAELAALAPDAIVAASSPVLGALQEATRTVPIVFVTCSTGKSAGFTPSRTFFTK